MSEFVRRVCEEIEAADASGSLDYVSVGDTSSTSHVVVITGIPDELIKRHMTSIENLPMATVGKVLAHIITDGVMKGSYTQREGTGGSRQQRTSNQAT